MDVQTQSCDTRKGDFVRRSMRRTLIVILAAVAVAACSRSNPEIRSEQAKLDLAEMTGDLDAAYLSLRRLSELGDISASSRIDKIKSAIAAREDMRRAVNDHDHESAIHYAAA